MFDGTPTFGTGAEGHIVLFMEGLVAFAVILFKVVADCLGDGVGAGGDPIFTKTRRFMTADAD